MSLKTVLIVEDDDWLAEQYARILTKNGYKVEVTLHALAAIRVVDKNTPDIIILDVLLTGSTAFAFMNELQSYGDTGDIPIILCTNLASDLSIENLAPYGVKVILDKTTMQPNDLVVAISSLE
jgi:CheY-like chemotaxis protein